VSARTRKTRSATVRLPIALEFNPNSMDAQFGRLTTMIEDHNKSDEQWHQRFDVFLRDIKDQTTVANGRVRSLEQKWKYVIGWLAGGSLAATVAWAIASHSIR